MHSSERASKAAQKACRHLRLGWAPALSVWRTCRLNGGGGGQQSEHQRWQTHRTKVTQRHVNVTWSSPQARSSLARSAGGQVCQKSNSGVRCEQQRAGPCYWCTFDKPAWPWGCMVRSGAKRTRIDPHWVGIERLARRTAGSGSFRRTMRTRLKDTCRRHTRRGPCTCTCNAKPATDRSVACKTNNRSPNRM